jgi:hypothetical protein
MRLLGFRPRGSPPPALASSDVAVTADDRPTTLLGVFSDFVRSPKTVVPNDRPTTVLAFLSDLARSREQARTFAFYSVFVVSAILLMLTGCFCLACFVVVMSAREVHGVPATAIVSTGIGGASLLTLVTALIARLVKRILKGGSRDGGTKKPPDTSS